MSASSTGIPPQIEHQLMALDKQLRDATFLRGIGRLVFGICLVLGASLLLDQLFDLNGTIRGGLLTAWALLAILLLWQGLIRPIVQPTSLAALAALIEKRHPELRERLTSLVELRGEEVNGIAPGASKLMQELLARQTVKVFERLDVQHVIPSGATARAMIAGLAALVLLFLPFGFFPGGYGLLWSRFFAPWGNYSWGAEIALKVWEGDQTIARGADAPVHVSILRRQSYRKPEKSSENSLWLTWHDEKGVSDIRRLDWDEATQQYTTSLTHVMRSLTFQVSTAGARSGVYRVDVSDPPAISRFSLQIEPAAYTGLVARIMEGVPAEIKVPERSQLQVTVEFSQPVASASLRWPGLVKHETTPLVKLEQPQIESSEIPLILSDDHRSGKISVTAEVSGAFAVRAKNQHGLQNEDPARSLIVIPDQPPQIAVDGDDEPLLVRPDEVIEISIDVRDDYGLTAVEFHAEGSKDVKKIESLDPQQLHEAQIQHLFKLDLAPFGLNGGQVVTYRIRAVDNRPEPHPQEVWSNPRLLMTNTSLRQLPDKELASAEKNLEDDLAKVRTELNQVKTGLSDLHRKTEDESLGKQPETDKSDRLDQLRQSQEKLVEQLNQLAHRLAEHGMTEKLADQARQIAEGEIRQSQDKVEQSKNQPVRDQLEPLAQAIDHLGNADRQLAQLDQQLNELNKLEQDLAELSRMAQRAERLANELEKMGANPPNSAANSVADGTKAANPPADAPDQKETSKAAEEAKQPAGPPENPGQNVASTAAAERQLQNLKQDGSNLSQQLNDLFRKHPELLESARQDQVDQLNRLAEQAKNLSAHQARLAEALKKSADQAVSQPAVTPSSPTGDASSDAVEKPSAPATEKPDAESPASASKPATNAKPAANQDQAAANPTAPKDSQNPSDQPRPATENGSKDENAAEPQNVPPKSSPDSVPKDSAMSAREQATAETATKQGADALQQQQQIASEATQQALQLLKETGSDSSATKAAANFAHRAEGAREQTQAGQLQAAAQQAEQAAQAADETARQLNPDGQTPSPQAEQAKQLAVRQRQAADKLRQLASSPSAVQGAQMQGQQQLSDATNQLAEQFQRTAGNLKSSPLNLPDQAESGEKATQMVQQAQKSMEQSKQANQKNDPLAAAKSAADAAEKLHDAAASIKPATSKPNAIPISSRIANPVTEAMKKMESAQQELSQCNCSKPGAAGSKPSSKPGQGIQAVASNETTNNPTAGQTPAASQPDPSSNSDSKSTDPKSERGEPAKAGTGQNTAGQEKAAGPQGEKSPTPSEGTNSGGDTQFSRAAQQFRALASSLRQARGELNENNSDGRPQTAEPSASFAQTEGQETSQAGSEGSVVDRAPMTPDIHDLDAQISQGQKSWGRLPGQLRTEILQGSGKRSHAEYKQRIKSYFEEISKPAK